MTAVAAWLLALAQSAGSVSQPPSGPPPTPAASTEAPAAADPARLLFPDGTSGLVLVLVKADKTADYEAVIRAVGEALAAGSAADREMAAGWQVFKAQEADAKGNAVYVHWIPTPRAGLDYRPSLLLGRLVPSVPEALLVKYRDALAAPPTRLSLDQLIAFGATRVPPPRR